MTTRDELSRRIDESEARERDLATQLNETTRETKRLRIERAALDGVAEGVVVLDRNGAPHIVRSVDATFFWQHKPWVKASPRRKDNTWSKQVTNLFDDYTIASPDQPAPAPHDPA